MKLWTVWQDYGATGEGRTLMARIAYAENAQEAVAGFGREFGPYFASGAEALEGVPENEVTKALFARAVLRRARQMEGRATLELSASFYFNFA
jgi:hypothetical protein